MKLFRVFKSVGELYFVLIAWSFMMIIYFSFAWFFISTLSPITYFMPVFFLLSMYAGYLVSGRYTVYEGRTENERHRKMVLLIPALIGIIPVIIIFLAKGNTGANISTIRETHAEGKSGASDTIGYTLLMFMYPLLLFSFILSNFNNLKYKLYINLLAIFACVCFIWIDGGRENFIIFGGLYSSIYFYKNFDTIKKNTFKFFFKLTWVFLLICVVAVLYSLLRLDKEGSVLVSHLLTLKYINSDAITSMSRLSFGIPLIVMISTVYDYTGSNISNLDIYILNSQNINLGYGFYQFNFLDKFGIIDREKTHDLVDAIYLKYDISYNVWATSLRDLMIDFGVTGSFIFIFVLAYIMFKARQNFKKSYFVQCLFFLLFAFFLFSPFHSLFYMSRPYCVAFIIAFCGSFKYIFARPKVPTYSLIS